MFYALGDNSSGQQSYPNVAMIMFTGFEMMSEALVSQTFHVE